MTEKKAILILVNLFLITIAFQIYNFLQATDLSGLTGEATTSETGRVSLCFNNPPQITAIPAQTATKTQLFSYQVLATDVNPNTSLSYYDNTSLFNISESGLISFTPNSSQLGSYQIEVKVGDNSSCLNSNVTTTFSLTVKEYVAPVTPPAAAAGGAGGGGGAPSAPLNVSFKLSQEILKVALTQSQRLDKEIYIFNDGEAELEIEISSPDPELIYISPAKFTLPAGGRAGITVVFNPKKEAPLGIFTGLAEIKAVYKSTRQEKDLALILEIESEEVFFDASLDLLKKEIFPEEELKATITLFNLKKIIPQANLTLTYLISDFKNKRIYEEKETLMVEDQVSFSKNVKLPEKTQPGEYLFSLQIQYANSFATASELFTVKKHPSALAGLAAPLMERPSFILSIPILFFLILVVLIIIFITVHMIHKKTKKQKNPLEVISLKKKLSLLEESHRIGFIRQETYRKTKAKLERLIRKKSP